MIETYLTLIGKYAKKGYEFTLMTVGESGLGKTTLINSLFMTKINQERVVPPTVDLLEKTLKIQTNSVDIEERGVRIKLTGMFFSCNTCPTCLC